MKLLQIILKVTPKRLLELVQAIISVTDGEVTTTTNNHDSNSRIKILCSRTIVAVTEDLQLRTIMKVT